MATKEVRPEYFPTLQDAAEWIARYDRGNIDNYRYKYVSYKGWKVYNRGART